MRTFQAAPARSTFRASALVMAASAALAVLAACADDPGDDGGAGEGAAVGSPAGAPDGARADAGAPEPGGAPDGADAQAPGDPGAERSDDPRTADPSFDPAGGEPAFDLPTLLDRVDERGSDGRLVALEEARPPLAREDVAVQNRHDPGRTDTVRTLRWAGLEVELYEVSASGRQMIRTITVDGDDYRTEDGLTAGSRRSEVEAALGEPDRTEEGASVYVLGGPDDPTPPELHVHYRNGFVQRLVWHYYVD